jgi:hypothetical protein
MMLGTAAARASVRAGLSSAGPSSWHGVVCSRFFSEEPKQRQLKVKKKAKPTPGGDTARSKDLALILASLDAPMRNEPPVSEEEKARRHQIGRNHVIGKFRQHNDLHHDFTCKIYMKKHAIKMLPRESKLKQDALEISDQCPPDWVDIPVWTRPIEDFDPTPFLPKEVL